MPSKNETALLSALTGITGTGNFHSQGAEDFFLPELEVDGVGELAFPLPAVQARELIAAAEAAPYGKGLETVRDDAVRRCWQIDASRLNLSSGVWNAFLGRVVGQVGKDLGIEAKVSAIPYKLLIYEKGGHFLPHRDTEKLEAMFGTLIIALPSAHEGGRLLIRHQGKEVAVDFSAAERRRSFQYAALFADCEHEVEPVRSGYRCCLVYNLRLEEGDPANLHQGPDALSDRIVPALKALTAERSGKLAAVLLEHSYTEANFSLRHLKGHDQNRARALLRAASASGCAAHLALVTFHQSGELEGADQDDYDYGRRRRRDQEDGEEEENSAHGAMGEIYEESLTISDWRNAEDQAVPLGHYSVAMEDLISGEKFGTGAPDEKQAEGYTGNAGCTMDYWYRRAAVVWWSRAEDEHVRCAYDLRGACRSLREMAGGMETPAGAAAFDRLAEAVVECFPEALPPAHSLIRQLEYRSAAGGQSDGMPGDPFPLTLDALTEAGDAGLLERLTARVPAEAFGLCGFELWSRMLRAFGTGPFSRLFTHLAGGDAAAVRALLFQILEALLEQGLDQDPAAAKLLAALIRLPPRAPARPWERTREPAPPGDVRETRLLLLASPILSGAAARKKAAEFLRADGSLNYVRGVLGPALLDPAVVKARESGNSLIPEFFRFAISLLEKETARPLPPFPDWTRPCPELPPLSSGPGFQSGGGPNHQSTLRELAAFMASPGEETHDFRRAQEIRSALETFIANHYLDVDQLTIRKGTPHTLRLTKNDNSRRHALAVRAEDETLLRGLTAR